MYNSNHRIWQSVCRIALAVLLTFTMTINPVWAVSVSVTYPNPGPMNVLFQQGFNPGVQCPDGYAKNSAENWQALSNGRYNFTYECVKTDLLIYNDTLTAVRSALSTKLGYDLAANLTSDLSQPEVNAIGQVRDSLSTAQLDALIAYGLENNNLTIPYEKRGNVILDPDFYTVYLAGLALPKYSGSFVEFAGNLLPNPNDPNRQMCPSDYLMLDPNSANYDTTEIMISPARWNTSAGDGIITYDKENDSNGFQYNIGIIYGHAGMAESNNSVRHLAMYFDHAKIYDSLHNYGLLFGINNLFESMQDFKTNMEKADIYFEPDTIQNALPGIYSESIANTIVDTSVKRGGYVRGFDPNNSMVLKPSDPIAHRALLNDASNAALAKEGYYNVYAFSKGGYGSGYGVCSTFVRDNLLDIYLQNDPNFMDTPVYPAFDALTKVGMNSQYAQLITNQTAPGYQGNAIKGDYDANLKAWLYYPEYRSWATETMYDYFMDKAGPIFYDKLKHSFASNGISLNFTEGQVEWITYTTRRKMATQMINCFAFNQCANQEAPDKGGWDRLSYYKSSVFLSNDYHTDDFRRPAWPVSSFQGRPQGEGYAFAPDDLLFIGPPYDRVEEFHQTESELIFPGNLSAPMKICEATTQYGGYDDCICHTDNQPCACNVSTNNPDMPPGDRYWITAQRNMQYKAYHYSTTNSYTSNNWVAPVSQTLKVKAFMGNQKSLIIKKGDKVKFTLSYQWADDINCTRNSFSTTSMVQVNGQVKFFKTGCGAYGDMSVPTLLTIERWETSP